MAEQSPTQKPDQAQHPLTGKEKELRDWLRGQPGGSEWWTVIKAGFVRSYEYGRSDEHAMHEAYRPEVVAEVAVHLGSHESWEEIAQWCGGRIDSSQDPSGEWSSTLVLPNGERGGEWAWLVLDHGGEFHIRAEVQAPCTSPVKKAQRPCGSCGEPGPYTIILGRKPVPACLRHLNHWRTPPHDYTCPSLCAEMNHPGREHNDWLDVSTPPAEEADRG